MKRTYQPSKLVRKGDMVLDQEWPQGQVDNSLQDEEQKVVKYFQANNS